MTSRGTPRSPRSDDLSREQTGTLVSNGQGLLTPKPRRSQVSARPLSPKRDRIAAEREEAAAEKRQRDDDERKQMRRKNALRAVLKSADGLYPRRCVSCPCDALTRA